MTHHPLHSTAFVARFSCLGDKCEDTCCKSWSMQVDDATYRKYQAEAPELVDAVAVGHDGGHIMRRDPATDFCVKFTDGLCGIHKEYGSDFLGDACNFFPRVTRRVGEEVFMTAALSCPEVVRLALFAEDAFAVGEGLSDRLPATMKDYRPDALPPADTLAVHQAFVGAALDGGHSPQRNMARIVSVAHSLAAFGVESWPMAVPFYLKSADDRLPPAERKDSDPFNLLHALMGLVAATGQQARPRLRDTIADMETALKVSLDWEGLGIRATGDSVAAYAQMEAAWDAHYAPALDPVLRKWVAAQLSIALFPFAGFGADAAQRAVLMGVRFATLRLALMSACHVAGRVVEEAQQVRIIQSIARVLDHLADPELSLKVYDEPGWLREARLRALMGDA